MGKVTSGSEKTAARLQHELRLLADPEQAANLCWFFKTERGEYGEGDIFLGVRTPLWRELIRAYRGMPPAEIGKLLESPIHEERSCALALLTDVYEKGDAVRKKEIYDYYLRKRARVNNWDLVDLSAPRIIGAYLLDKSEKERAVLYDLVRSESLWDRRIAMLATFAFIRDGQYEDTLRMAAMLLDDGEDLMHKAAGWMLREVGKHDPDEERRFLDEYHTVMPRTMLRYALEKFDRQEREKYMKRA
jgi:3-methyladenine DNA glycosylase AlkD